MSDSTLCKAAGAAVLLNAAIAAAVSFLHSYRLSRRQLSPSLRLRRLPRWPELPLSPGGAYRRLSGEQPRP